MKMASLVPSTVGSSIDRFRDAQAVQIHGTPQKVEEKLNNIIYLVGLVVVVVAILSFLGLR